MIDSSVVTHQCCLPCVLRLACVLRFSDGEFRGLAAAVRPLLVRVVVYLAQATGLTLNDSCKKALRDQSARFVFTSEDVGASEVRVKALPVTELARGTIIHRSSLPCGHLGSLPSFRVCRQDSGCGGRGCQQHVGARRPAV